MRRGGGMAGEIHEHRAALLDAGVGVCLLHDPLRPRLVQASIEDELGAMLGIVVGRDDRPPCEHLGETRDIVLAIAGAHTECVQLEDFAREILVQAAGAIDAGNGVRARWK